MNIFADTSALYPLLDMDDNDHLALVSVMRQLREAADRLVTTNYVVVETFSLLQKRQSLVAANLFVENIVPLLAVAWIDPEIHEAAISAVLTAGRRDLSLVDCASFAYMRYNHIWRAFTLDAHFREQGFECLPE